MIRDVGQAFLTPSISFQIFHCVHFECPAQDADSKKALEAEIKKLNSTTTAASSAFGEKGDREKPVTTAATTLVVRRPMTAAELKNFNVHGDVTEEAEEQEAEPVGEASVMDIV